MLRRRRRCRGAVALVLAGSLGALFTGVLGAVDAAAAMSAQARAQAAADAIAHGTVAMLLTDPDREQLSIDVQAGQPCDTDVDSSATGAPCARAMRAAAELAAANHAVLRRLVVGPDPRVMRDGHAAGPVLTEADVFVARGLPIQLGHCPSQPGSGSDMCWAEAWSAAQGAG